MHPNDAFHLATTIIEVTAGASDFQASGTFYACFGADNGAVPPGPGWARIEDVWLVTNRHVVLAQQDGIEQLPDALRFCLRRIEPDGSLHWEEITLGMEDVRQRARFHKDSEVDVALVRVLDLMSERLSDTSKKFASFFPLTNKMFAGENCIDVEVADDVVVVGYPHGFYDETNLFPIVKAGIIASKWGANFEGKPRFLIDARLFPGSSGSVVLSKPRDIVVRDKKVFQNEVKQFAFLGIYSSDPYRDGRTIEVGDLVIHQKLNSGVGVVWYAHVVEEILANGVTADDLGL